MSVTQLAGRGASHSWLEDLKQTVDMLFSMLFAIERFQLLLMLYLFAIEDPWACEMRGGEGEGEEPKRQRGGGEVRSRKTEAQDGRTAAEATPVNPRNPARGDRGQQLGGAE